METHIICTLILCRPNASITSGPVGLNQRSSLIPSTTKVFVAHAIAAKLLTKMGDGVEQNEVHRDIGTTPGGLPISRAFALRPGRGTNREAKVSKPNEKFVA